MAIENVVQLPGTKRVINQHGNGGNGGDGVEARIARVESDVKNISGNLVLMWDDIREIRRYGIALFIITWAGIITTALGLAGIMAKGFGWI